LPPELYFLLQKLKFTIQPNPYYGPALPQYRALVKHVPGFVVHPSLELVITEGNVIDIQNPLDHSTAVEKPAEEALTELPVDGALTELPAENVPTENAPAGEKLEEKAPNLSAAEVDQTKVRNLKISCI